MFLKSEGELGMQCSERPKGGIRFPGTGVNRWLWTTPCRYWDSNPHPLQEDKEPLPLSHLFTLWLFCRLAFRWLSRQICWVERKAEVGMGGMNFHDKVPMRWEDMQAGTSRNLQRGHCVLLVWHLASHFSRLAWDEDHFISMKPQLTVLGENRSPERLFMTSVGLSCPDKNYSTQKRTLVQAWIVP